VSLPVRRVSPTELRRIFNEGRYYERLGKGELLASVESDRPARPEAGQPVGTRSQMVWYYDSSLRRVALVHQYVRADGTLGASGRPDPKRVLLEQEILFC
jgi:hypothetical protein